MADNASQTASKSIVFLLDVDNTLLDNDKLKSDLTTRLESLLGAERAAEFWRTYEMVRQEEDYVDYPTTVRRWVEASGDPNGGKALQQVLDSIDFPSYLYPHALDAIAYLRTIGTPAVLSDGDSVFQPQKIRESGIEAAVNGNVLIYIHKEAELPKVFSRFGADHYVMVDDKPRILSALEQTCPTTFTTVMVLQGKYARLNEYKPAPDYVLPAIADLRKLTPEQFLTGSGVPAA